MPDKVKICNVCGRTGDQVEFKLGRNLCIDCYKDRQQSWYEKNKEKILSEQKEWYDNTPVEKRFSPRLQGIYKKSSVWFEKLLEIQDSKCAICGSDKPGGRGFWHLDHNHATGECRGFLCHHCNLGIGNLKEKETTLLAALSYLRNPPSRHLGEDEWYKISPTEKKCGECGETLSLDCFNKASSGGDTLSSWCKDCMKEYRKQDHIKNKERDNTRSKEWNLAHQKRK